MDREGDNPYAAPVDVAFSTKTSPARRLWWIAVVLGLCALGLTILLVAAEVFLPGGGIPYQDPTPEQTQEQNLHAAIIDPILILAALAWLATILAMLFASVVTLASMAFKVRSSAKRTSAARGDTSSSV